MFTAPGQENATVHLEVMPESRANQGTHWQSPEDYEEAIQVVEDRGRDLCRRGAECCMNITVESFAVEDSMPRATVVVECAGGSCPNAQHVGETAMNRVPGLGDKAYILPLETV